MAWWPQLATIAGVVLLVAVVLVLKGRTGGPASSALPEAVSQAQTTAVLPQAETQVPPTGSPEELPEAQLERHLTAGRPTLAFFHSNDCVQCVKMMRVVAEVYPEFADSVALVDVNVYDRRNASLLQRARIRAIPTQIFFNRSQEGIVIIGAMTSEQLRERLQSLVGGQ